MIDQHGVCSLLCDDASPSVANCEWRLRADACAVRAKHVRALCRRSRTNSSQTQRRCWTRSCNPRRPMRIVVLSICLLACTQAKPSEGPSDDATTDGDGKTDDGDGSDGGTPTIWRPHPGTSWQWQLSGTIVT